jgi:hypothetical protein
MRGRVIAALALVAVGLVWVGQGLGLLTGGSFMVGDPLWAVIGAVLVIAGAGLGVSAWLGRPRP